MTDHFDINLWADFVRDTASERQRAQMRRHLDSGCASCDGVVARLRQVTGEATRREHSSPPDHAVRSVKAFFALQRPRPESLLRRVLLSTIYDSALQPAAVAVRGEHEGVRQLSLESGDFRLELSLEEPPGRGELQLEGQFLRRGGEPVADSPAYLVVDGAVAASGFTDRMGCFELELPSGPRAQIWLGPDPAHLIVADLPAGSPAP